MLPADQRWELLERSSRGKSVLTLRSSLRRLGTCLTSSRATEVKRRSREHLRRRQLWLETFEPGVNSKPRARVHAYNLLQVSINRLRRVIRAWWSSRSSKSLPRHFVSGGRFDSYPLRQPSLACSPFNASFGWQATKGCPPKLKAEADLSYVHAAFTLRSVSPA